jgi:hypothetical protein
LHSILVYNNLSGLFIIIGLNNSFAGEAAMLYFIEFFKTKTHIKWELFMAIVFLSAILGGVEWVHARGELRVDTPNPKVEPLVETASDIPQITSLAEGYRGPGVYEIETSSDAEVNLVIRWCTKTENIRAQNLEHIDFMFEVNGLDMLSRLHNYEEVDDDGEGGMMYCHGYRGLISDWPIGVHEIKYALIMDGAISDGWDDYPAGEIAWEFKVNVSKDGEATSELSAVGPQVSMLVNRGLEIPHIGTLADVYEGPGEYIVEATSESELRVFVRWCSQTKEILEQNLTYIHFSFEVNGHNALDRLFNFDEIHDDYDKNGAAAYCFGYRGLLSDWPSGYHEIRYSISVDEALDDGWEINPAGVQTWAFRVSVPYIAQMNDGAPTITVNLDTNCRRGPGKAYEIIGDLQVGEQGQVIGNYPDADYWVIIEPTLGRECWLWGNYATVTGDTSPLRNYTAPAMPTATPTPTPIPAIDVVCFCNNTGQFISAIKLYNDDTDELMGELGDDGIPSGSCDCFTTGGPYPLGDYFIECWECEDGEDCLDFGERYTEGFELSTENQTININP